MTLYEQIQKAVDLVEAGSPLIRNQEILAREVGMSVRSFHHWFRAVTGIGYRDYVHRRRLARAADALVAGKASILDTALDHGFGSHGGFTRAFRAEFGRSPRDWRARPGPSGLARLNLVEELYMGIVIKKLPRMRSAVFMSIGPAPEDGAHRLLAAWLAARGTTRHRGRVFGHNVDGKGTMSCGPDYQGYKLYATLEDGDDGSGAIVEPLEAGTFMVTGIEGSFDKDPGGSWIGDGWRRLNALAAERGHAAAPSARWYEEELEPATAGNMRFDLYLELVKP